MPWCARCGTGISQTEMNEGYQDRDDPGLTVRFPLLDRPGRVAPGLDDHALDADLERRGGRRADPALRPGAPGRRTSSGSARARSRPRSQGPFEVLEEVAGADMVGWRYAGPFDDLPAVQTAFADGTTDARRSVRAPRRRLDRGRRGRGHRHRPRRPGLRRRGLPARQARSACRSSAPLDESRHLPGRLRLAHRRAMSATSPSRSSSTSSARDRFYRLETINHRYPHCWRCGTPLVFRLVDEWYISMGPLYDQPRETLTPEQVDASLRYQIMDVVDQIRWIPDFGYERELDWLRNMHDWMISKKRYWGLALPIYDCAACGTVEVIGGREELKERAVEGWRAFEGHTPHRPYVDAVRIACPGCGEPVERIKDVGNPWLDAGIVPFSTLHFREDPEYWRAVVPGRLHHRELPRPVPQLVLLDARDVARSSRREPPFKTIFGYAPLFAEDGRPMHKSCGQRDRVRRGGRPDGRRRHALDVRQGAARGEHPVRLARRRRGATRAARPVERLRVLRDLRPAARAGRPTDARRRRSAERPVLDRWILSRAAGTAADGRGAPARRRRGRRDAGAVRPSSTGCRPGTCACRGVASRAPTTRPTGMPPSRRSTRRSSRPPGCWRRSCRSSPTRCTATSSRRPCADAPDSVHLTRWPTADLAASPRRGARGVDGDRAQGAVDLARTLRSPAHLKTRQPLATRVARDCPDRGVAVGRRPAPAHRRRDQRQGGRASSTTSSDARRAARQAAPAQDRQAARARPSRRSWPPPAPARSRSRRTARSRWPASRLAPDEVEIQATPRPGTAVADHDGLVVVLDTSLTPALVAEGDARELARAVQDLRREAGLELDDRIELWVDGRCRPTVAPHLPTVAADTLADLGDRRRRRPTRARAIGRARRRPGRHRAPSTAGRPRAMATRDAERTEPADDVPTRRPMRAGRPTSRPAATAPQRGALARLLRAARSGSSSSTS